MKIGKQYKRGALESNFNILTNNQTEKLISNSECVIKKRENSIQKVY